MFIDIKINWNMINIDISSADSEREGMTRWMLKNKTVRKAVA